MLVSLGADGDVASRFLMSSRSLVPWVVDERSHGLRPRLWISLVIGSWGVDIRSHSPRSVPTLTAASLPPSLPELSFDFLLSFFFFFRLSSLAGSLEELESCFFFSEISALAFFSFSFFNLISLSFSASSSSFPRRMMTSLSLADSALHSSGL